TFLRATLLVSIILVLLFAFWAKQYYENRYVGADYYAMVPLDFDTTPTMMHSMSGAEVGLGKRYELTAFDEQGNAKAVEFTVRLDRETLPLPGAFLYIKASKQLVISWREIDESSIPKGALQMIK
ncbi:MAG: YxeA family protein, partial [Symbiobacteriaceae bacterium]|nr:YxeA family protein [Symbiobacteriaceae bacterium]